MVITKAKPAHKLLAGLISNLEVGSMLELGQLFPGLAKDTVAWVVETVENEKGFASVVLNGFYMDVKWSSIRLVHHKANDIFEVRVL